MRTTLLLLALLPLAPTIPASAAPASSTSGAGARREERDFAEEDAAAERAMPRWYHVQPCGPRPARAGLPPL